MQNKKNSFPSKSRFLPGFNEICIIFMVLSLILLSQTSYAVRGNWGVRQVGPLMEKAGQYEEAAFFYRAALDFYASVLQFWIGTPYDDGVDDIYQQYAQAFGEKGWRSAEYEERWDTMKAYLFFFNRDGAARNIEKGDFSAAQRQRLENRIRVYIEDIIDPDYGFGGDFSFSRKAWILERTGLFWHAAYRRELAGRYAIEVCNRYYSAIADEMERVFGDPMQADLYRQKAIWWRNRGMNELHLCNGDRALARLKGNEPLKRLNVDEVIAILREALQTGNINARRAAVHILIDIGEFAILESAMGDSSIEIRKAVATAFAAKMYLPGLALALADEATDVQAVAQGVLDVKPESEGPYLWAIGFLKDGLKTDRTRAFASEQLQRLSGKNFGDHPAAWHDWVDQTQAGLQPGIRMTYFDAPIQPRPTTTGIFETVDIGMKFQANFPKVWYGYWDKPEIFPESATGPFRLQITSHLYIPSDANYRFYVKTVVPNQAIVSIKKGDDIEQPIITTENIEQLQYVTQAGMPTHRIDFSSPIALEKGMVRLRIVYSGEEVRNIRKGGYDHITAISGIQKVGLQLFWSSDHHLRELVPAANLFHDVRIEN